MKRLLWSVLAAALMTMVFVVPVSAQVVDDGGLTVEMLLSAAGAGIAAVIVASFVELLKKVFPPLDARVSGAFMAFTVTAILYIWVWFASGPATANEQLSLIVAWLTCATAAVGANSVVKHTAAQAGVVALQSPKTAQRAVETLAKNSGTTSGTVTITSETTDTP